MNVIKIIFNIVRVLIILVNIFFIGLWIEEMIRVMIEFIRWYLVLVGLW